MSHNRFYRFILDHLIQDEKFQQKTDRDGHLYVMYHLTVPANKKALLSVDDKTYRLTSHHLSFYEKQRADNPALSQYHYTADFTDQADRTYRLHVHFDSQDRLTTAPIFSIYNVANQAFEKQEIDDELADNLLQFAATHSMGVVAQLRRKQTLVLSGLQQSFNQVETNLQQLSIDMITNRELYLAALSRSIEIAASLTLYHEGQIYLSVQRLFQRMYFVITTTRPVAEMSEMLAIEEKKSSGKSSSEPTDRAPLRTVIPVVQMEEAFQAVTQSRAVYNALDKDKTPEDELVNKFTEYTTHVKNTDVLLENEEGTLTVDQLRLAQQYLLDNNAEGKKLLQKLLLANRFDLAFSLRSFLNPVPEQLVKMALLAGNAKLLDFLITHGDVPVNTFIVKDELNPALFCLASLSDRISKADCFGVLVKHKANVMVLMPDGFSLAHHVLSVNDHPFRKALLDNLDATEKMHLYRALIRYVDGCLGESTVSGLNRMQLLRVARSFHGALSQTIQFSSPSNQSRLDQIDESSRKIAKLYEQDILDDISNSGEVKSLALQLELLARSCAEMQSEGSKKQLLKTSVATMEQLHRYLLEVDVKSIPDIKQYAIQALKDFIELLKLRIEFVRDKKLVLELNQTLSGKRKPSKKHKQAAARQGVALKRINEITANYSFLEEDDSFFDSAAHLEPPTVTEFAGDLYEGRKIKNSTYTMLGRLLGTVDDYLDGKLPHVSVTEELAKQLRATQAARKAHAMTEKKEEAEKTPAKKPEEEKTPELDKSASFSGSKM